MGQFSQIKDRSGLLKGIKEDEIESMLECLSAVKKGYRKGEYVFRRGDRVSCAALLLEGCIHIQKEDYWGNLSILNEISPGSSSARSMPAWAMRSSCITRWR